MNSGRACITTKYQSLISEMVHVNIKGVNFQIHVKEIGTWSTQIFNDMDSNDSGDGRDIEERRSSNEYGEEEPNGICDDDVQQIEEEDDILKTSTLPETSKDLKEEATHQVTDFSKPSGFENFVKENKECPRSSNSSRTVGGALGYDVRGCKKSHRKMINGIGLCFKHNIHILGILETKMTRVEFFQLRSMWGNFNFDNGCSMARGRSGGMVTLWDPNVFIKKRMWCGDNYIILEGNRKNTEEVVALDRVWSDHNPILLHSKKHDFGPIPFKVFHSWFSRPDFETFVKDRWAIITSNDLEFSRPLHTKLKDLKSHLKYWYSHTKETEISRKASLLANLRDLEKRIDDGHVTDEEKATCINKLQELDNLENLESMDLFQKARVKWDVEGANSAFITLIPKVTNPLYIKDYCPISLIGVHYKIIAKILANRLSKVINSIMSPGQSAFISGRQILDGPLVLCEIIDLYKKRNKKLMLFKVDFEKAFDSVSWRYLDYVLDKRALRQGDPLSPFLFIIVMEGLHMALNDGIAANMFHGVKIGSNINIHKSNVYGVGVSSNEIVSMAACTSYEAVRWSNILASLNNGGLGVESLCGFNKALLLKWRWRLFQNPSALWGQVIKAIHGEEAGVDLRGCQTNEVWASTVGTINHFHSSGIVPLSCIRFRVGDGSSIRFWKDTWLGNEPFCIRYNRLFHLASFKDCSIQDRISNGSWNWDWSMPLVTCRSKSEFDKLILYIANLDEDEMADSDSCIWSLSHDGIFSVNMVRKLIDDLSLPTISPSTRWLKKTSKKDEIRSKPDKNGKRGEAGKSLKQLQ
nr:RNA-directed DNA polymerase, eukaryota, reverse transcriptase zinc-binding domain protein [Tanacetum cinerariifolium]